ncbi:MAG: hypothetical protein Q7J01_03025 [Syntrophales bacterium]|nr:hypothetical protein [Syntrophales bacterium]
MTYPPETLQRAFENSYAVVFALKDSRVIGSGRGIGRMIIDAILKRIEDCNIILYASPGKEAFYERLSFQRMRTGMALFLNPELMRQRVFIAQSGGLNARPY